MSKGKPTPKRSQVLRDKRVKNLTMHYEALKSKPLAFVKLFGLDALKMVLVKDETNELPQSA